MFKARVVDGLPVPILLGRDCPVYERYGPLDPRKITPRPKSRVKQSAKKPLSFRVFAAPSDQQSGSETVTTESGVVNVPPDDEAETPSNFEGFSEFPQAELLERDRPGQFGTAQLQDHNLKQAWKSIKAVDDQLLEGVSELTCPHIRDKIVDLTRALKLWRRH